MANTPGPWIGNGRHPSTQHMVNMLNPNPNLTGKAAILAHQFWGMTVQMLETLEDSPELTAGLRKLLEAKDCFVRASLDLEPVDYRDR